MCTFIFGVVMNAQAAPRSDSECHTNPRLGYPPNMNDGLRRYLNKIKALSIAETGIAARQNPSPARGTANFSPTITRFALGRPIPFKKPAISRNFLPYARVAEWQTRRT